MKETCALDQLEAQEARDDGMLQQRGWIGRIKVGEKARTSSSKGVEETQNTHERERERQG